MPPLPHITWEHTSPRTHRRTLQRDCEEQNGGNASRETGGAAMWRYTALQQQLLQYTELMVMFNMSIWSNRRCDGNEENNIHHVALSVHSDLLPAWTLLLWNCKVISTTSSTFSKITLILLILVILVSGWKAQLCRQEPECWIVRSVLELF